MNNKSSVENSLRWTIGIIAGTLAAEWGAQALVVATFAKGLPFAVALLTPIILGIVGVCCLYTFCGKAYDLFGTQPRSFWRFAKGLSFESILSGIVVAAVSIGTTYANHIFGFHSVQDQWLIAGSGLSAILVNLIAGAILFKWFGDL